MANLSRGKTVDAVKLQTQVNSSIFTMQLVDSENNYTDRCYSINPGVEQPFGSVVLDWAQYFTTPLRYTVKVDFWLPSFGPPEEYDINESPLRLTIKAQGRDVPPPDDKVLIVEADEEAGIKVQQELPKISLRWIWKESCACGRTHHAR